MGLALDLIKPIFDAGSGLIQAGSAEHTANTNARMSELQALDALFRGEKAAASYSEEFQQLRASQTSGYVAQGVDLATGSPLEIAAQTEEAGARDLATIRTNAMMEAFGYRTQADIYKGKASEAQLAGLVSLGTGIITGGMAGYNYVKSQDKSTAAYKTAAV